MSQYAYDEEGGQFFTFVLTFLLLVLVPLTWSLLSGLTKKTRSQGWFDATGQKVLAIKRLNRRTLTNPRISKKFIIVLVGWIGAAFVANKVASSAATSQHSVYDPFTILGIAASAAPKEIKKHYKKLSIKFHPDKIRLSGNQTKESVEAHYIELTKAYKALTDDTIRKNFELYGHPDGRQEMSMGIALPTWVVAGQNNIWVLGAYGLLFGLTLPYLFARWWYGSRSRTKDGLYVSTAQTFFQHLKEDTNGPRIMALLAISEEFEDPKLDKKGKDADEGALQEMEDKVRARLKAKGPKWALTPTFRTPSIRKTLVLLYAHLFRIESKSTRLTEERYRAAAKAERLLNGMLSIALAHNWLDLTNLLMDMIQAFVQAVPIDEDREVAELLQLGEIKLENARDLVSKKDIVREGIQGLLKLEDAERSELLGAKTLGQEEYDQMIKVAREWPRIEFVDAFFKVSGEKFVTGGAIVQLVVKVRALPVSRDDTLLSNGIRPGSLQVESEDDVRSGLDDDEEQTNALGGKVSLEASSSEGKQTLGAAHAPHFPLERKPHWWVFLGDSKQDRIIVQPSKVTDVGPDQVRSFTIQFQAPPNAGLYTFTAQIKSDSYLGSDAQRFVKLRVEDPDAVYDDGEAAWEEEEDEISEPEEDTLAGQMALMRGQRVKPSPVHRMRKAKDNDDDDDNEEGEEGEEEDGESGTDEEIDVDEVDDSDTDAEN